jgi:hypothetical protein
MPRLKHFYGRNHLHYLTANTYRKARIFDSHRYKRKLVQTLDDLAAQVSGRNGMLGRADKSTTTLVTSERFGAGHSTPL